MRAFLVSLGLLVAIAAAAAVILEGYVARDVDRVFALSSARVGHEGSVAARDWMARQSEPFAALGQAGSDHRAHQEGKVPAE